MNLKKRLLPVLFLFLLTFVIFSTSGMKAEAATPAPTGSLTINDENGKIKSTSSYSAYQIVTFDAGKDSAGATVFTNMKLNATYKSAIIGVVPGLSASSTDSEMLTAISKLNGDQTAALAIALKGVSAAPIYTTNNGVFSSMVYGYYLVIETVNNANDGTVISKPILVCVPDSKTGIADVVVNVKTSKGNIEKKIVESNNTLVDSSTAAVGDRIFYQSLSSIPSYSADAINITYYVTDTFSAGLTFDASSIAAMIVKADGTVVHNLATSEYTLATTGIDGATFRLTLNSSDSIKSWGNSGYKLLVTYSAILNEHVTYGNTGNPNSIKLTYSTFPGVYTTPDDTVITYTTKLIIKKTDSNNNLLSGAIFELSIKNSDDTWTIVDNKTTGSDGSIEFTKLKQGIYKLVEKTAPAGYELLANPIEFIISAKNGSISIPDKTINVTQSGNTAALEFKATWESNNASITESNGIFNSNIINTKGFVLPGTGGIGTTIFTVCGIVIILFGCVMGFLYIRKNKAIKQS